MTWKMFVDNIVSTMNDSKVGDSGGSIERVTAKGGKTIESEGT